LFFYLSSLSVYLIFCHLGSVRAVAGRFCRGAHGRLAAAAGVRWPLSPLSARAAGRAATAGAGCGEFFFSYLSEIEMPVRLYGLYLFCDGFLNDLWNLLILYGSIQIL
jgi:hypothetical protein